MSRLNWLVFCVVILLPRVVSAQSMRLQDATLGSVVQIGSFNYVKIAENKYMQSEKVICPHGAKVGDMYVKCVATAEEVEQECTADCSEACPDGYEYVEDLKKCYTHCGANSSRNASNPSQCDCNSGYYYTFTSATSYTTSYTTSGGSCQTISSLLGHTTLQAFTASDCSKIVTPSAGSYTLVGTLTDTRDNNTYEVRKFSDGICWMVDNMKYTSNAEYTTDYATYGSLYTWANASTSNLICPTPWRLPTGGSGAEFERLYTANNNDVTTLRINWKINNYPGAYNYSIGSRDSQAWWWSSTVNTSNLSTAYRLYVDSSGTVLTAGSDTKRVGLPVRCVIK